MPTSDAGRVCTDDGECEGHCLANPNPVQHDLPKQRRTLAMMGACTPHRPVFGCMAIVKKGFVTGLECRD
jgi:hypothetical protein